MKEDKIIETIGKYGAYAMVLGAVIGFVACTYIVANIVIDLLKYYCNAFC